MYFDINIARKVSKDILYWKVELEKVGYYASLEMLLEFILWWNLRDGPFILQGKPGTGKTSFVNAVCKVMQTKPHRIDCDPQTSRKQALYEWNKFLQKITANNVEKEFVKAGKRATSRDIEPAIYNMDHIFIRPLLATILDPSDHPIALINELDKVPLRSPFHSLVLTFFDEFAITIEEMNTTITRNNKPAPHIFITSNAGDKESKYSGGEEELPQTILRRGPVYKIEEHTLGKQFEILTSLCPKLPKEVVLDSIYFIKANETGNLEKPISLSEIIKWVKRLEFLEIDKLTEGTVKSTVRALAKTEYDTKTLITNCPSVFSQSIPNLKSKIDVEQLFQDEKQQEFELLKQITEQTGD